MTGPQVSAKPLERSPAPGNPVLAGLVAILVCGGLVAVSVLGIGSYGAVVFVAIPILLGVVAAWLYRPLRRLEAVFHGQAVLIVALVGLLAVALEGAICLAMAWPLAAPLTLVGSFIGHALARRSAGDGRRVAPVLVAALLLPLLAWGERAATGPAAVHPVTTTVEVDAPPAVVWNRVIAFPDLPPPEGIFATGIAAPLRATIEGTGVGALRRCTFTTGDFLEPITVWDAPRRLAFDVVGQPPTMRELSPWGDVHPPHLDGFFRSHRGEFRLEPLPGGRTRLIGTTWYSVAMAPGPYWRWWCEGIVHAIHRRVLEHVAGLAAADAAGTGEARAAAFDG